MSVDISIMQTANRPLAYSKLRTELHMPLNSSTIGDGSIVVLEPKGSLGGGPETEEIRNRVEALLAIGNLKLIVDLTAVSYLGSSALAILGEASRSYTRRQGKLILCNLSRSVENSLRTRKQRLPFATASSREQAIFDLGPGVGDE